MKGSNLQITISRGDSLMRLTATSNGARIVVAQGEVYFDRDELLDLAVAARALAERSD